METLQAASLPPGFGFHPTDVELISHYLKRKILGKKIDFEVIPEVEIYKHEPWDLPAQCHVPTRDSKWHFFASRDKKYPNGSRSNRATEAGYWKSTGKDRSIRSKNQVIGTKKTLVFHEGRPPSGKRSDWIMHEYYINENECKDAPELKDSYVLCRVTKRNGWGVDDEIVPPQTEIVDGCSEQPKDVASLVEPEKSSSQSETVEDIEAWFTELFDPNFSTTPTLSEVKNEPTEAISSLAVNQETLDTHFLPEALEDSHLLFPVEEFCDILYSDAQSFDPFGELDIRNVDNFDDEQGDIFTDLNNTEISSLGDDNSAGIQIREREVKPPALVINHRIRLQMSKMESRNGASLSRTIKVEKNVHLDSYDEKKAILKPSKVAAAPKDPIARKWTAKSAGFSCVRGLARGLRDFFSMSCSSESASCFFLCACMMGIVALICYFLMRDARRFFGSFSALEL